MATSETERIEPNEPLPDPRPGADDRAPRAVPAVVPNPPPALEQAVEPSGQPNVADQLRAEFAEIATIAAQAARLGVTVDAADAMRKGIAADALRRSVLDTLAARSDATSVIAAAPSTPTGGESPIVRRAKERASAARV